MQARLVRIHHSPKRQRGTAGDIETTKNTKGTKLVLQIREIRGQKMTWEFKASSDSLRVLRVLRGSKIREIRGSINQNGCFARSPNLQRVRFV